MPIDFLTLLSGCFGVLVFVGLLQCFWAEARTQRVMGNFPLILRLKMAHLVWKTGHRAGMIGTVTLFLGGLVLLLLLGMIPRIFFVLATIGMVLAWWLHMTCPPVIIVLTSSGDKGAKLFHDVVVAITPLRATALLNEKAYDRSWDSLTEFNNLRTLQDADWQNVVHTLIDLAVVVVLDTRRASPAVVLETRRMLHPDRAGKTLFVCDSNDFYGAAYAAAGSEANSEMVSLDQIRFTSPEEVGPLLQTALRGGWVPRLSGVLKNPRRRSWREFLYELRWVLLLVTLLSALSGTLLLVPGWTF